MDPSLISATSHASLDITSASITEIQDALSNTTLTSVELVTRYIRRIARLDSRGPTLNSIILINPKVFEEARASDRYRASGREPRSLEGIPFTVKDSFSVAGLTVSAASPAFSDLVASEDSAVVASLRRAGAVLIGKTNMPPMADGGSQRGLYGTSASPYNPEYLCTSFASGSSYGSAVATTASFAPLGIGSETVSSGRAPASHNAVVGYTPSRGCIPCRGLWPLYPTCDDVATHTKSMDDLLHALNALVQADEMAPVGDFWREQPFVPLPSHSDMRPGNFLDLRDQHALRGKRIAAPRCYIGQQTSTGYTVACTDATLLLWRQAKADLEALGATVVETDFPVVENYSKKSSATQAANVHGLPTGWLETERCQMIAMAWDDFLKINKDPRYPGLSKIDHRNINPGFAPMDDPVEFTEAQNQVRYAEMIDQVRSRTGTLYDLPGCSDALWALETARKQDLEDWMDENAFDLIAFPTNGDVGRADAEELRTSMMDALRDGVKYSNGNRAIRHLGIPAITVPMGDMVDKGMPVGMTFAGKAHADRDLLRYAWAYEAATDRRTSPPLAPTLDSDVISHLRPLSGVEIDQTGLLRLTLDMKKVHPRPVDDRHAIDIQLAGTIECDSCSNVEVSVFSNTGDISVLLVENRQWKWEATLERALIAEKYPVPGKIPRDQFMVVVFARGPHGVSDAALWQID
ncbi:amidase [Plectosphaerella plurivora]|uniref:Amidase n=1 Tax=Plectosphaerella plurivora TaxID=936078 RepID=A0A9P9AA65_9PEZI|nr:amidase [Plectosphaerella plurivora]